MADSQAEQTNNSAKQQSTESTNGEDSVEIKPVKKKTPKYSDPPIIYRDVDGASAGSKIMELVGQSLSDEERRIMDDWIDYLKTEGEAWKLDDEHISLIARLLGEENKFPPNVPLLALEILQTAALKDDFVLALHGDRKNHRLMSYIYKIESLTLAEQEEIAKLLCNFCSQPCSFDWLMYISEWNEADGTPSSNCRVTTRVAVHTLLNDQLTTLQRTGVNLIFNLSLRELFEESATELATAVLQYLHGNIEEEQVFLCLTSLVRFMAISLNEVPALTQMLGPDFEKYKGMSPRVEELASQIMARVAALSAKQAESED